VRSTISRFENRAEKAIFEGFLMDLSLSELESYFARVNYAGPHEPSLGVLRELQHRHTHTFPFENLDVLLGRGIRLDTGALTEKLIRARRGGYCFEQNGLFQHVLAALGFTVTPLAARVRWQVPDDVATGRTHMLLKVDLAEGPYIVDVGFGGLNPTAPFALTPGLAQPTGLETYRITAFGGFYALEALLGEAWATLYRFTLEPNPPPDQEISNWFVSTAPTSRFVLNLTLALPAGDKRYTLFNDRFTIRHRDGRVEERTLGGAAGLIDTVRRYFGLDMDAIAGAEGAKAIAERCFPAGRNRVR
jgi:N-hydroxyarylamine O-acetyltransferase